MSRTRKPWRLLQALAETALGSKSTRKASTYAERRRAPQNGASGLCAFPEIEGEPADLIAKLARQSPEPAMTLAQLDQLLRTVRDATPMHRALRSVASAPSLAVAELLTLPVAFAALGAPYTITFARKQMVAVCTNSRAVFAAEQGKRPTFVFRELEAAARAVELGRAGPMHLDQWLQAKQRGAWVLALETAGGELASEPEQVAPMLTFGELFDALGAVLLDVVVHEPKEAA